MKHDPVEVVFRRAALPLLPARSAVLVAVSGGGDSMALLHLMARFGARRGLSILVAHLDHGLRRGSAADRRFVEAAASEHGLRCVSDRRLVASLRRKDESPEEAARRVRRAFLLETAREADCPRIATGHTLDDQAETILMRWARGAGPTALTAMDPAGPEPFVRPLLGIERSALRDYLERHQVAFRDDPSNRALRFDRNRVRRLVLPVLTEHVNPAAARHVVQAAGRSRDDSLYLDGLAERALRQAITEHERPDAFALSAARLARAPRPIALRMARLALERAGVDPRRISSRHVEVLLALAVGEDGACADLPRLHVRRTAGVLRLGPARRG